MEELKGCPLCGSENYAPQQKVKDYSTSEEVFTICECHKCGLLFTNPRPAASEILKYYDSPKYISHTNSKRGLFASVYQAARKMALKQKLRWIDEFITSKPGTLLDYGSGTGEFLNYARSKGWSTTGIEIADKAKASSIKTYDLTVFSPEEITSVSKASQDVVTMWHVLEHLPDLHKTPGEIFSKLKPGGLCVIAVPNHESPDAKRYKEYWAAWDVPIHFYHFGKQNIKEFAEKHGLYLVAIKTMPFDAYYISLLSEEYKSGRKNWAEALKNGFLSNLKGRKDNSSSLTYILKKNDA